MTPRERLTLVYRGGRADRVPWAPIIDGTTLSTYPQEIIEKGIINFTREMGADVLFRGGAVSIRNPVVEVLSHSDSHFGYVEYQTKVGSLYEKYKGSRLVEHQIKTVEDYKIMEYILENQECVENYDAFLSADQAVGDAGIVTVGIGPSPVQRLLQFEMGVEKFCYDLFDHTQEIEDLMALMHEKDKEVYQVAAASPAEFIMLYENTSTTMISPDIYERYSLKHVKDFVDIMHRHNKVAIVHMCGKLNRLLPLIKKTGLDAIDCLTPEPTGDVNFSDAYRIFRDGFVIHGILDPSKFAQRPIHEIERSIEALLTADVLSKPFVFCTAADGLAGIPIEKFQAIGKIMQKYKL